MADGPSFSEVVQGTCSHQQHSSSSADPQPSLKLVSLFENKPCVAFSRSEVQTLENDLKFALIGKFSHGRPPLESIRTFLVNLNLSGSFNLANLSNKHVLINCSCYADFYRIWLRLVWIIDGFCMRMFKWESCYTPAKESSIAPVWIRIEGLPLQMFDDMPLRSIANALGKPIKVDTRNINKTLLTHARVCIELDVAKPLVDAIRLSIVDDANGKEVEGRWLQIFYDVVPKYCVHCFHIGHGAENCKRKEPLASPMDECPAAQTTCRKVWLPVASETMQITHETPSSRPAIAQVTIEQSAAVRAPVAVQNEGNTDQMQATISVEEEGRKEPKLQQISDQGDAVGVGKQTCVYRAELSPSNGSKLQQISDQGDAVGVGKQTCVYRAELSPSNGSKLQQISDLQTTLVHSGADMEHSKPAACTLGKDNGLSQNLQLELVKMSEQKHPIKVGDTVADVSEQKQPSWADQMEAIDAELQASKQNQKESRSMTPKSAGLGSTGAIPIAQKTTKALPAMATEHTVHYVRASKEGYYKNFLILNVTGFQEMSTLQQKETAAIIMADFYQWKVTNDIEKDLQMELTRSEERDSEKEWQVVTHKKKRSSRDNTTPRDLCSNATGSTDSIKERQGSKVGSDLSLDTEQKMEQLYARIQKMKRDSPLKRQLQSELMVLRGA